MINLISTPKKYNGKNVQVKGVYDASEVHPESCSAIYFSSWDIENMNDINSICVGPGGSHPEWNGKAVLVQGIFNSDAKGSRGMWNMRTGTISKLQRLEPVDTSFLKSPGREIRGPIHENRSKDKKGNNKN